MFSSPTPIELLHSLKIFKKGLILPPPLNFYTHWRSSIRVQSPTPSKLLHSLKIFNKGLILPPPVNFYIHCRSSLMMMIMMMMMMTITMWNEPAHVPVLCVLIYNIKLIIVPKYPIFTTCSAHTKKARPTGAGKTRCLAVILLSCKISFLNVQFTLQCTCDGASLTWCSRFLMLWWVIWYLYIYI